VYYITFSRRSGLPNPNPYGGDVGFGVGCRWFGGAWFCLVGVGVGADRGCGTGVGVGGTAGCCWVRCGVGVGAVCWFRVFGVGC
jgi:hypothetical protein